MSIDLYQKAVLEASAHKTLYHYTTFSSLEKILSNRSLRLSRLDQVNDKLENGRLDEGLSNRIYVFCATHMQDESYELWRVYTEKPGSKNDSSKQGVLLSFDSTSLLENTGFYTDEALKDKIPSPSSPRTRISPDSEWVIQHVILGDIQYVQSPTAYTKLDCELQDFFKNTIIPDGRCPYNISLYPGLIKRNAWHSEYETRLRVAICHKSGILTEKPPFQYIYMPISEKFLNSLTITLTPSSSPDFIDDVVSLLNRTNIPLNNRIIKSILTDEISFN